MDTLKESMVNLPDVDNKNSNESFCSTQYQQKYQILKKRIFSFQKIYLLHYVCFFVLLSNFNWLVLIFLTNNVTQKQGYIDFHHWGTYTSKVGG